MSTAFPIPRAVRRQDLVAVAAGQTVFGVSDFRVYDAADLRVRARTASSTFRTLPSTAWSASLSGAAPAFPTVTLVTGRAAGDVVRIEGSRVASRLTDVTLAGTLRGVALETELDRVAVTQQELKRDHDDVADGLDAVGDAVVQVAAASAAAGASQAAAATSAAAAAVSAAQAGNKLDFAVTRLQIPFTIIPQTSFRTTGYYSSGDYGAGAFYTAGSSDRKGAIQDAAGTWFAPTPIGGIVFAGWFGAKGNGTTNDTAAIQDALDCGARIVFLPPAVCAIAAASGFNALVFNGSGITLTGVPGSALKKLGACDAFFFSSGFATLRDFELNGNSQGGAFGILCSQYNTIERVYAHDSGGFGWNFSGQFAYGFDANGVLDVNSGVKFPSRVSAYNILRQCRVENVANIMLNCFLSKHNLIEANRLFRAGGEAVCLDAESDYCIVVNNRIDWTGFNGSVGGIGVDQVEHCIISFNEIDRSDWSQVENGSRAFGGSGIHFRNQDGAGNFTNSTRIGTRYNAVIGNTITRSSGHAIRLTYDTTGGVGKICEFNTIVGNIARNSNWDVPNNTQRAGSTFLDYQIDPECRPNAFGPNIGNSSTSALTAGSNTLGHRLLLWDDGPGGYWGQAIQPGEYRTFYPAASGATWGAEFADGSFATAWQMLSDAAGAHLVPGGNGIRNIGANGRAVATVFTNVVDLPSRSTDPPAPPSGHAAIAYVNGVLRKFTGGTWSNL